MAVFETDSLIQYKDKDGNMYVIYPITKRENIIGINDVSTVTVSADGWSDEAPYVQTVTIDGVTPSSVPDVYLYYPDSIDESNAEAYVEAYGYINKVETADNALVITAFYEKPTMDITLMIKGV